MDHNIKFADFDHYTVVMSGNILTWEIHTETLGDAVFDLLVNGSGKIDMSVLACAEERMVEKMGLSTNDESG